MFWINGRVSVTIDCWSSVDTFWLVFDTEFFSICDGNGKLYDALEAGLFGVCIWFCIIFSKFCTSCCCVVWLDNSWGSANISPILSGTVMLPTKTRTNILVMCLQISVNSLVYSQTTISLITDIFDIYKTGSQNRTESH